MLLQLIITEQISVCQEMFFGTFFGKKDILIIDRKDRVVAKCAEEAITRELYQ